MIDPDLVTIQGDGLTIEIAARGAELQRIVDRQGRDYLWNGDPAWWTGRAPLLFPIVGALRNGEYRLGDRTFRMLKHGFARATTFELVEAEGPLAIFRLAADDDTRAQYPFEFVLDVSYEIVERSLRIGIEVANRSAEPMPMSFGFHPALRWPLPDAGPRAEHILRFEEAETGPTFRWDRDGLVSPLAHPNPVGDRTLRPTDALFADDAVFFPAPASRSIWFGVPGERGIELAYNLPELGLWTKPGAPFLCIEPWQGHNDPQGFDRDFRDKPGIVEVAPGANWTAAIALTLKREDEAA